MKLEFGDKAWGVFEGGVNPVTVATANEHVATVMLDDNPEAGSCKVCRHCLHPTRALALKHYKLYLESLIADAEQQIEHQQKRIKQLEKDLAEARKEEQLVDPREMESR